MMTAQFNSRCSQAAQPLRIIRMHQHLQVQSWAKSVLPGMFGGSSSWRRCCRNPLAQHPCRRSRQGRCPVPCSTPPAREWLQQWGWPLPLSRASGVQVGGVGGAGCPHEHSCCPSMWTSPPRLPTVAAAVCPAGGARRGARLGGSGEAHCWHGARSGRPAAPGGQIGSRTAGHPSKLPAPAGGAAGSAASGCSRQRPAAAAIAGWRGMLRIM